MSRVRSLPARTLAVLGAALAALVLSACGEDGKGVPARCADPPLPIYDIQNAGAPSDDFARFNDPGEPPCVTEIGHAVGPAVGGGNSGGSASNGGTGAASSTSGGAGLGGSPADAGAGGA